MKIGDAVVSLLGDPHLGKKFVNGVPLHRRGEREQRQMQKFREHLMNPEALCHVCMGDIFDKFIVSPSVVLFAAECYVDAAMANPSTQYVLIRGNHDASRDSSLRSSFDVLSALLAGVPNIGVVTNTPMYAGPFAFVPWHPFKNAAQMVSEVSVRCAAVFGHWDLDSFGGSDDNLIPIQQLKGKTELVVTGHVHTPQERIMEGIKVIATGSMEPYSHGEDPQGLIYRTVTLAELKTLPDTKDLCLRVRLEADEQIDFEVDCLQLQVQRNGVDETEVVSFETFDLENLFHQTFQEFGVSLAQTKNFWDRLKNQTGGIC